MGIKLNGTDLEKSCVMVPIGSGESRNYICQIGKGIFLWANEIHDSRLDLSPYGFTPEGLMVINLCLSGRCEILLPDDSYVYMMPGLLSVSSYKPSGGYSYPGSLYEGIEIAFSPGALSVREPSWLGSFGLSIEYLKHLLTDGKISVMAEAGEGALKTASDLFLSLRKQNHPMEEYRFMAVHLLYQLKNGSASPLKTMHYATRGQRRIANEVENRITADLRQHYTVQELAACCGISPSALKKYFSVVYGKPISRYMREKRMEQARKLLAGTNQNIGDIAAACGYENQGKFGAAFKAECGILPLEYRRQHYPAFEPAGKVRQAESS